MLNIYYIQTEKEPPQCWFSSNSSCLLYCNKNCTKAKREQSKNYLQRKRVSEEARLLNKNSGIIGKGNQYHRSTLTRAGQLVRPEASQSERARVLQHQYVQHHGSDRRCSTKRKVWRYSGMSLCWVCRWASHFKVQSLRQRVTRTCHHLRLISVQSAGVETALRPRDVRSSSVDHLLCYETLECSHLTDSATFGSKWLVS